jgi:DNA polymerase-3 subunit gamma/tau
MAYLALYRKYRPQTFDDIMGQRHVTRTLQNALRNDRVAHAYLFCGPRGTAKTTTARVLAKALNCEHGPTPDPCDACDACERVREGRSLDVLEIDAASNRGIDDIKLLREQVGRASAQERYKLYIIDEVHQLSADAFQALLKTLEEPPPNVVFVLATTETHRVPKTIISRCQRFDFRRGTLKELSDRLQFVAESEGMAAEPEALQAIARAAAGGWRDALSLLEQVAAYSPERIDRAAADAVLGSVEESALFRLTDALAAGDAAALFNEISELIDGGKEPRQMLSALNGHLRDLLWMRSGAENASQILPESAPRYREQAKRVSPGLLVSALEAIGQAESQMRWVSDQRLLLEVTLIKIASGKPQPAPQADPPAPKATASGRASASVAGKKPIPVASASEEDDSAGDEPFAEPARPEPPRFEASRAEAIETPPVREAPSPPPAPEPDGAGDENDEYLRDDENIEGGLDDLWRRVIQKVRPNVRGLLTQGKPLGVSGKTFRVGLAYRPHIDILERKENREQIEKALKEALGRELRVKGELAVAPPAAEREERTAFSDSPPPSISPFATDDYMSDTEFSDFFNAKKIKEGEH